MSVVLREDRGPIAVITLNRPDRRNALSGELIQELLAVFATLEQAPDIRVAVLTGAGDVFCAGGDLTDAASGDGLLDGHRRRGAFAALLKAVRAARFPVVAAVHGDALGGGCGLVAACDLVVADERARLGLPEIKLGLYPWIVLAVLSRDVPRKVLLEATLTGEPWTAEEARRHGLVNRIAAPGAALAEAIALADRIATRSPAVVALGKAAFHTVTELPLDEALSFMHSQLTLNLLTEDAMEGVAAFLERRPPQWKGR
jgi:enoyl-CoA hydratase